jgi:hypothetical protein
VAQNDLAALNGGAPIHTDEEQRDGFEPMPPGWYALQCVKAELKDTSTGGKMVVVEFEVIGERFNGRKVFQRLNVINRNADAEKIGRRELAHLGQACGYPNGVTGTDQLLGKQLDGRLAIREGREVDGKTYGADNEIKAYAALGSKSAQQAQAAKPAGQQGARAWQTSSTPSPSAPAATTATSAAPATTPSSTTPPARAKRPWE